MYVRYTKRKPSGSGRLSVDPIYEALSWLSPFIKTRTNSSNMPQIHDKISIVESAEVMNYTTSHAVEEVGFGDNILLNSVLTWPSPLSLLSCTPPSPDTCEAGSNLRGKNRRKKSPSEAVKL